VIDVGGVSKVFENGTVALENISARIEAGEFLALLGPSGCGKSTLLRLLAGLEAPTAGAILWAAGRPKAGEIGFVFQDATLLPWATALDNVVLPLRLLRRARGPAREEAAAALAQVGLGEFLSAKPAALSGGMRMRVSIARALVARPKILLMDEPFAALDEFTRQNLQADLRELWRRTGLTVVFVTHSTYEAAYLASRVLVMSPRPGRIAADFASTVAGEADRRDAPSYAAFVTEMSHQLRQVMPVRESAA
jgi:NitT/TauT family transport system ATP-binding protein